MFTRLCNIYVFTKKMIILCSNLISLNIIIENTIENVQSDENFALRTLYWK